MFCSFLISLESRLSFSLSCSSCLVYVVVFPLLDLCFRRKLNHFLTASLSILLKASNPLASAKSKAIFPTSLPDEGNPRKKNSIIWTISSANKELACYSREVGNNMYMIWFNKPKWFSLPSCALRRILLLPPYLQSNAYSLMPSCEFICRMWCNAGCVSLPDFLQISRLHLLANWASPDFCVQTVRSTLNSDSVYTGSLYLWKPSLCHILSHQWHIYNP